VVVVVSGVGAVGFGGKASDPMIEHAANLMPEAATEEIDADFVTHVTAFMGRTVAVMNELISLQAELVELVGELSEPVDRAAERSRVLRAEVQALRRSLAPGDLAPKPPGHRPRTA
jgi:hypothetical protein